MQFERLGVAFEKYGIWNRVWSKPDFVWRSIPFGPNRSIIRVAQPANIHARFAVMVWAVESDDEIAIVLNPNFHRLVWTEF